MKLRTRVFLNFVLIVALFGVLAAVIGAVIINRTVVNEAQRRVELDLRSAWSLMDTRQKEMKLFLQSIARSPGVAAVFEAEANGERQRVRAEFDCLRQLGDLDFLGVTDRTGRVVLRTLEPFKTGDTLVNDPFVDKARKGEPLSGFALLGPERLEREGGTMLQERARIPFRATRKAKERLTDAVTRGMAVVAAVPALDERGEHVGVVYAGVLLNRNNDLVDSIRSDLFEEEGGTYEGKHLGTVTIFQWDARIATNVRLENGNRALGTRVSAEVYDRVLENNQSWYDRAYVVNDWYLSAYDPIHDVEGNTIGILYVGVLAEKYDDIRRELWTVYGGLSLLVGLVVLALGIVFAQRLTGSLHRLAEAASRVAAGDLEQSVEEPNARDEVRDLTQAFNTMTVSLYDRDRRLREANQKLEKANRELQQLNADYLDLLGFVSHELKNTLGIIFTAARTLDGGFVGEMTPPQAKLVYHIRRSIETAVTMTRHYLDLAHIEQGKLNVDRRPIDLIEDVLEPVMAELGSVAEEKDVTVERELPEKLPLWGDESLLRVVYKNLIDNALKYGREGGKIRLRSSVQDETYRLEVWNEGHGLPPDKIDRLFRKFARFAEDEREERRGTGLGLFITREIIVKHGGDIWAESEEGDWISFIFTLPLLPRPELEKPEDQDD